MKTGIVFSCFNIENKLDAPKLIQLLYEQEHYHFCFVNDCSSDDTNKILNSISEKIPHRTSIINLEKKSGRSESLRAGVQYLQKLSFINYIGFFNNILNLDFDSLDAMVESLQYSDSASIVFGIEQKRKEKYFLYQLFLKRFSCGKEINEFLKIKDSTTVLSKSIAQILFDRPFLSNHLFYLEILLRLKLLFGEKNLSKFILIKNLKIRQTHNKRHVSFYQGLNFPILLVRFCINYTLLSNGYLLTR